MGSTRRGFTIVEIIVTISIMGILLTLAVVTLTATQTQARDEERKSDIGTIQTDLENFYRVGLVSSSVYPGSYPKVSVTTPATLKTYMPEADTKPFIAPGATTVAQTFTAATNNTQTTAGVTPQPTVQQYVYQPIASDGSLCSAEPCRKYNLYYKLEKDGAVYQVVSKNT